MNLLDAVGALVRLLHVVDLTVPVQSLHSLNAVILTSVDSEKLLEKKL